MKIRKLRRRKRAEWVLDYRQNGTRHRKWFKTRIDAEGALKNLQGQREQCGEMFADLPPHERNDLMGVYLEAREAGFTVRQLWEAHKAGKLEATPMQRRTLLQCIDDLTESKKAEGRAERYVKELGNYLRQFALGRGGDYVDRVRPADVEAWFADRGEAPSTRNSNLGRLSSLFDFAWRRGYISENPCLKVSQVKLPQTPPEIFPVEDVKKLLKHCRAELPEMLGWLALSVFVGLRPDEAAQITWGDIDLRRKIVKVEACTSKVRYRRVTPLEATALAWLRASKRGTAESRVAPLPTTLRRRRRELREHMDWDGWPQDAARHTAVSYLLELHENAPLVAKRCAHSVRTLETKSKNVVTPQECKAFWALTPAKLKG